MRKNKLQRNKVRRSGNASVGTSMDLMDRMASSSAAVALIYNLKIENRPNQ